MHYISKCEDWVIEQYPENEEGCNYKLSDYAIVEPYRDGIMLFHTITWSFFFLTQEEYDNILTNKFFIEKRIVLSDKIEETPIAEEIYMMRSTRKDFTPYTELSKFVVLTTNECNANCPYCYEWLKKGKMSIETAEKFISFVKEKNIHNKTVRIEWFGGEPLKNIDIIDYVTKRLKEENINYESTMTSNSLLLTKEVVDKAVESWHLKRIQVTIDGPEEMYNKIKNYSNFEGNAFKQVIENIRYVKEHTDIVIIIRINISHENIDYIEELADYLLSDICGGNVSLYFKMEYDTANNVELLKKDGFEDRYYALLNKYTYDETRFLIQKNKLMNCMADNCGCVAIAPNGNIHSCEHCRETSKIGNLNDGIIHKDVIDNILSKGGINIEFCKKVGCKLMPVCHKFNFCYPERRCEKEDMFEYENEFFIKKMKYTTDYYFKKLEERKNEKGEG